MAHVPPRQINHEGKKIYPHGKAGAVAVGITAAAALGALIKWALGSK